MKKVKNLTLLSIIFTIPAYAMENSTVEGSSTSKKEDFLKEYYENLHELNEKIEAINRNENRLTKRKLLEKLNICMHRLRKMLQEIKKFPVDKEIEKLESEVMECLERYEFAKKSIEDIFKNGNSFPTKNINIDKKPISNVKFYEKELPLYYIKIDDEKELPSHSFRRLVACCMMRRDSVPMISADVSVSTSTPIFVSIRTFLQLDELRKKDINEENIIRDIIIGEIIRYIIRENVKKCFRDCSFVAFVKDFLKKMDVIKLDELELPPLSSMSRGPFLLDLRKDINEENIIRDIIIKENVKECFRDCFFVASVEDSLKKINK